MRKYRARCGRTGHGEEVQDTVRKYRARWGSTGHGEKVQGTDGSTGHGGEVQGAVGISKCYFYLALLQKMVLLADEWENSQELLKRGGKVICGLG